MLYERFVVETFYDILSYMHLISIIGIILHKFRQIAWHTLYCNLIYHKYFYEIIKKIIKILIIKLFCTLTRFLTFEFISG